MSQTNSFAIAIIGSGFSGTMVAVHLLRYANRPLTIKLIERKPVLGQGIAYSTNWDCHLLNVPASKMSAFADDPDHFLRWLHYHNQGTASVKADTLLPRKVYGEYIQAVLNEAIAVAGDEVRLERLTDEAIAIKMDSDGAGVCLSSGEILKADRVVLAVGNFPPSNPPIADPSFYQSKRYIGWAWSGRLSTTISPDDPVLLIGSGLTALDVAIALHQQGHKGKIYMVSRRGILPQSHQFAAAYPSFIGAEVPKSIRALLRQVRQEIEKATDLGYDWRAVIDALRPQTQTIWQALSLAERRRFLRHVRPYWEVHRHRVAPAIAQAITELRDTKQLVLHAGRIQAYHEDADGVNVVVRQRCNSEFTVLRVGTVINCTGSERACCKLQHPLILNLLASGLVRPDPLNLGLDVALNGALVSATGITSKRLYTLGPPQKGCFWETTAVPEIRQQAQTLARQLLEFPTR